VDGKKIEEKVLSNLVVGENIFQSKIKNLRGTYLLTIETPFEKSTQKIILKP
jgi:hypothetical protein